MTSPTEKNRRTPPLRIALAGNPNAGKTSLFNRLTGSAQKVGNWGGVTVDIKQGTLRSKQGPVTVIDLPGTYSLSACSPEEEVARNYIVDEKPDIVIDVIDATNLDRHLYLVLQLLELGVRPVLALNMWDEVEAKGYAIDTVLLEKLLGLTVVPTNARGGTGISELLDASVRQHHSTPGTGTPLYTPTLPPELDAAVTRLATEIDKLPRIKYAPRWIAQQLLEQDKEIERVIGELPGGKALLELRNRLLDEVTRVLGDAPELFIAEQRYGFIAGAVKQTVHRVKPDRVDISERIDAVITHRFWAYPIFFLFMWTLFQATFKLGEYPMEWIEALFEWLGELAHIALPQGVVRDLVADGVIAGVGGVIVFLPNILILFLGISIMEDTGYMARAAFIMDNLMHRIGLHGKSFIPMLMGLGCSVPAIMAARTLESPKDRIKTILLTPLISCSARLPVFVLFAAALFPRHAGNVVFLFQVVLGFAAFILMGLLFKHTLFRSAPDYPFVMELPPYRLPTLQSILIHMWHKARHYLKKMGGVVLVFSVLLWWAGTYPEAPHIEADYDQRIELVRADTDIDEEARMALLGELEHEKHAALVGHTWVGRTGRLFEPLVRPFGTDWRGAVSLVTGFVAKEVVVSSMSVLYAAGEDEDEESESLREKISDVFTPLSAFAFMLFVLLYTPCVVALVTIIRELRSWKWSLFSVGYQLVLAWTAATVVYQVGSVLGL